MCRLSFEFSTKALPQMSQMKHLGPWVAQCFLMACQDFSWREQGLEVGLEGSGLKVHW